MGSSCGGCDGRRRAEEVEMGADGVYYKGDHEHDGGAARNPIEWTNEPHYNEQFAENDGHDESVFERRDEREPQGLWEDDCERKPDEFECANDGEYQGQYYNMGSGGGRRENGVPSGT